MPEHCVRIGHVSWNKLTWQKLQWANSSVFHVIDLAAVVQMIKQQLIIAH